MTRRIPLTSIAGAGLKSVYERLAVEMGGPMRTLRLRGGRPEPFIDFKTDLKFGNVDHGEAIMKGHFEFAGQHVDVGANGDPWSIALPSEDFAIWLHSFAWLKDLYTLDTTQAAVRARFLYDRWIAVYGAWNSYSWQPDILTGRLFALLVHWVPLMALDKLTPAGQVRRTNTVRQLKRLRHTYRRTTPGIMRMKAAATLALGGARLAERSDGFLDRGLDWLDDEIDVQILPDGGHITRSPAHTLEALEILLALDQMLNRRGVEGTRAMGRAIDRLLPACAFFKAADGGLVSFNGGHAVSPARVHAVLGAVPKPPNAFKSAPHSGYQRAANGDTVLVMDTGSTPPRPYDLDSHIAPLAIEISGSAGRLIVNCGWHPHQPHSWRRPMRSTAAHSTLTLGDQSAGALLKPGLGTRVMGDAVARGTGHVKVARKDQPEGIWMEATHEGYVETTGLAHTRRLYVNAEGTDFRGEDSLALPSGSVPVSRAEIPYDIRFHLHPDVRVTLAQDQKSALLIQRGKVGWRLRTDGGPLKIEASAYLAEGHRPARCEQIIISGTAFCDSDGTTKSNRVRWSLRQLEPRK